MDNVTGAARDGERIEPLDSQLVKLRDHRKARGLTIRKLAAASGASTATLSHIENRKMKRVNMPTLSKLAAALDTTVGGLAFPPLAGARENAAR